MTTEQLIAAIMAYEAIAWSSRGRVPTITTLCKKSRWIELAFIAFIFLHVEFGAGHGSD